jgi:hypothetical protein
MVMICHKPSFVQWRKRQTILEVRRRNVDLPEVPGRADGRTVNNECGADDREKQRRDTEESYVEGSEPEVEHVAAEKRASADPIFLFKTEHRHCGVIAGFGHRQRRSGQARNA